MKEKIKEEVLRSIRAVMKGGDARAGNFEIETPKQKEFGDFSTNAAMTLSADAGKNPRELADEMARFLKDSSSGMFEKVEVAGPGFINFFLKPAVILEELPEIMRQDGRWGTSETGEEKTVLIEFVSANPTGPLHFGHARNAVFGDALAKTLEFAGWKVTREFYINDTGKQIAMLGESVRANLLELEGGRAEIPEDGYRGEYISEIAREIFEKTGGDAETGAGFCGQFACEKLLAAIRDDLKFIGVEFDKWVSEKDLLHSAREDGKSMIDETMEKLRGTGAVKTRELAQWFKSTDHGDSQDWVLIKKDGSPTYFLADIAYHGEKFSRGYDKLINVWGADHHSHVARMKSAIGALGFDKSLLDVLLIQFVRLVRDGKEVSMGKRAGSYVTLREVVERVGADVTRFFLLMRAAESHLDFDLELACKQSNENPVYYIQYAHARIESIRRNAARQNLSHDGKLLGLLGLEAEIEIAKQLLAFPDVVRDSARTFAPHKIAFYLQALASGFHSYYNANRVITDDIKLSSARLFLCECVKIVFRNGLGLLGVSAPERM